MIKLSKMTDYAVVILAEMAGAQGALMSAAGLSEKTGLPEPTVSKVLKLLTRADVITSTRGAGGGYSFEANPKDISIAGIIAALEGPVALTACVDGGQGCCDYEQSCKMKGQWNPVNEAMRSALEGVSLDQMMRGQR